MNVFLLNLAVMVLSEDMNRNKKLLKPEKNGVNLVSNLRKMTVSKVINVCKTLILLGLQKNKNKISTQVLTVLKIWL